MSTLIAQVNFDGLTNATLPLTNIQGTNIQVDWGDESQIETFSNGTENATHSYTNNDNYDYQYEIVVTGNITGLGDNAFYSGYYTEVNLPEGITTIGDACFRGSKIEYLIIPKTVTSIGNQFNYDNAVLKELDIKGNSLITIGTDFCFRATQLRTLKLPDSITNIGIRALSVCSSLKELTVPKNLTGFPLFFLQNAMLDTIIFKNGPINRPPITESTKIIVPINKLQEFLLHSNYPNEKSRYGFYGETLAEKIYILGVVLAEGLSDKDVLANANEGLKPLANKILDIGGTEYRNLTYEIDWDDNDNEFELRPSQLPVLLLANGEVIDGCILSQDNNYLYQTSVHKYDVNDEEIIYTWQLLENVKQYYKQEVDINQNAHKTIMTLTPLILTYRGGEFSSYNNTPFSFSDALNIDWDDDTISTYDGGMLTHTFDDNSIDHTIAIKGDLTALNDNCFLDCVGLTSATLSDNITRFGTSCFRNCSKLENINIPNNITSLEQYCFDGCSSLTNINIPNSVTNIKYACFRGCSSLTSITIPDSITALEGNCFQSCTNLTNVTLPNTFTTLGQCSFQFCDYLVQINLPNTLTSTATNCFYGCSRLTNITLPNTLTNLAYGTFSRAGLTTISIPSGVTNIGAYCFSDCNGLSEIVIPEATTNIGMRCFYYCRNLHDIIFKGEVPPTIGNYCFDGVTATITVPYGSLSAYEAALSGKGGNLTIVEDYETPL